MPHGGPHLPGGEALTADAEGNVTGAPEEEFQVTSEEDSRALDPIGAPKTVRGPGGEPVPFQAIRQRTIPGTQDVLTGRGPLGDRGQPPSVLTRGVPPQYFRGHEKLPALFDISSTEDILRTQLALEEAGLIDDYSPGEWDINTWGKSDSEGFRAVLAHANVNGVDWKTALNRLVTNPPVDKDGDGDGGPEPYLPPDYATMAQGIKGWMRQNLGRDPRDHEITTLAQQVEQLYRADYDQEQQNNEYQQQVEAGLTEERDALGRDVDVKARFSEMLEERYANELRTVEAEDEAGRTQDIATGFGNLFRSMIGS